MLQKYDNVHYLILDMLKSCCGVLTKNTIELLFKRGMELNTNFGDMKLIKLYSENGCDSKVFEYLLYFNTDFDFYEINNYDLHKIALDYLNPNNKNFLFKLSKYLDSEFKNLKFYILSDHNLIHDHLNYLDPVFMEKFKLSSLNTLKRLLLNILKKNYNNNDLDINYIDEITYFNNINMRLANQNKPTIDVDKFFNEIVKIKKYKH